MPTPSISKLTWIGEAIETTPGTAITVPARYIPCKSTMHGTRKPEYANEDRNSRDADFLAIYGQRTGGLSLKGSWYNDACVPLLHGVMGNIASAQPNASAAPTVYKHTLSYANTPPVFTFAKGYVSQSYYLSYAAVEKLQLKFTGNSKLLEFDATIKSRYPLNLASPPTPTFTSVRPFAGYMPKLTLTSLGANTTDILEFEVTFEQKLEEWNPAAGVADFTTLYFGERKVTFSYTARFDVNTLWTGYWDTPTDDAITFDVQGDNIASTYNQELNVSLPLVNYDSVEHDEGKTNVMVKVKGTARPKYDATVDPASVFVQNTVSSYAAG